jgi:hypothetical protein
MRGAAKRRSAERLPCGGWSRRSRGQHKEISNDIYIVSANSIAPNQDMPMKWRDKVD